MNNDLKRYCVRDDATIFDGIQSLENSEAGFSVVVDADDKVQGVLTDGDVRRALLEGNALMQPVLPHVHTDFLSVGEEATRTEVLDLMQALKIRHVPVLGRDRHLKGIHLFSSIIGSRERPNWAVIMAGGKGTRLYPLTKDIPKPMVKVAGRPILERLVLHLVSHGIDRIFLSVNHLSDVIQDYFGDGERFGCRIEYLHEDDPLGTAGSLSLLPEAPSDPILVMNGDLVMDADLGAMLDYHEYGDYHATIGIKTYAHQVPYGCVTLDGGCVVGIKEKPKLIQQVNAGVYVLSPQAVKAIPLEFYPITELFASALQKGDRIGAFELDCDWVDVGQHDQLKQARGEV